MSAKLTVPPEFAAVSSNERIAYVQELWDRIARDPERVQVSNEHKRILDSRLNAYAMDPQAGKAWSVLRNELLAKLRS